MAKKGLRQAFTYTLPVLAGYVFLGIAFGLILRAVGYPLWLPVLMSLLIYSGALEFAAVPLLAQPFSPLSTFLLGLMISARHLFYGIPMLGKYRNTGAEKPFLIFGLTDETFSLLSTVDVPEGMKPKSFYRLITLMHYFYWNLGTFLGALLGSILGNRLEGLDFALTALFIVLFLEQLKGKSGKISGVTGLIASAAMMLLFGSEKLVVLAMAAIAVLLTAGRRVIDSE